MSQTVHIGVTPEQAFDFFTKAERIPEWHVPAGIEVKDITGPLTTIGAGYTVASRFLGRKMELHWTITGVERPRLVEMKSTGTMTTTMFVRFEPAAGGTDATLGGDYELPLGFVGEAADKLLFERSMLRETEESLKKLKAIVEAEALVHA